MEECDLPANVLFLTGDLVDAYLSWKDAATQCAAKVHRLNQWYNESGSSRNVNTESKGKK